MIRALAEYEKLAHLCVAAEADVEAALFGPRPAAEVLIAWKGSVPVAFALFFHNFSTFLGRRGIWLEDLFVRQYRRQGARRRCSDSAQIAVERDCARFEWAVLDWNAPAIEFYRALGATVLAEWRIVRSSDRRSPPLPSARLPNHRCDGIALPDPRIVATTQPMKAGLPTGIRARFPARHSLRVSAALAIE
jgi:GNAT superfamily N-acetyltransferase